MKNVNLQNFIELKNQLDFEEIKKCNWAKTLTGDIKIDIDNYIPKVILYLEKTFNFNFSENMEFLEITEEGFANAMDLEFDYNGYNFILRVLFDYEEITFRSDEKEPIIELIYSVPADENWTFFEKWLDLYGSSVSVLDNITIKDFSEFIKNAEKDYTSWNFKKIYKDN